MPGPELEEGRAVGAHLPPPRWRWSEGSGRPRTLEEQEVAVYFSHFLFEAPLASLRPLPPSRASRDTGRQPQNGSLLY